MATKRYRLAQRRKAVGFSQELFAERLEIDRSTVARWESGETENGPQPWIRPNPAQALQGPLISLTSGKPSLKCSYVRSPRTSSKRASIDRQRYRAS